MPRFTEWDIRQSRYCVRGCLSGQKKNDGTLLDRPQLCVCDGPHARQLCKRRHLEVAPRGVDRKAPKSVPELQKASPLVPQCPAFKLFVFGWKMRLLQDFHLEEVSPYRVFDRGTYFDRFCEDRPLQSPSLLAERRSVCLDLDLHHLDRS